MVRKKPASAGFLLLAIHGRHPTGRRWRDVKNFSRKFFVAREKPRQAI